jgi:hypothetical protein
MQALRRAVRVAALRAVMEPQENPQENADEEEIRRLKEETSAVTRQGHAEQDEIDQLNQETGEGDSKAEDDCRACSGAKPRQRREPAG